MRPVIEEGAGLSTWVRIVWDLGCGVALLLGAFNVRDFALRIYRHIPNRAGVSFTDLRTTCTIFGAIFLSMGMILLAHGLWP